MAVGISISEILVILLIAFLVVGPSNLPKVARGLAKAIRFLREKWSEFIEEAELSETVDEFKKANKDIKKSLKGMVPKADLEKDLKTFVKETDESVSSLKDAVKTNLDPTDKGAEV